MSSRLVAMVLAMVPAGLKTEVVARQGVATVPVFGGLLASLAVGLVSGESAPLTGRDLELAEAGRTEYVVVQAEKATDAEKFAVSELTNFLGRVTGASFPVVDEAAFSGKTSGIYVGWTAFAARHGIEASALGEEEWVIRTVGKNLVLTGGRPRGTLYAVYEFLERQVGCHWLDPETEVVPSKPSLALAKLDIRNKPRFPRRELVDHGLTARGLRPGADAVLFYIRNKSFRYDLLGDTNLAPRGAFSRWYGSPGESHTFAAYLSASNWFATHPEYFAVDTLGKRAPVCSLFGSPAQLCLTQPDVRRLVLERLREFIARDRAEAAREGVPPPRVYDISQNDNSRFCQCTNCQAVAVREGGESGPLIDFINAVAAGIEPDYPDILVQTFAYGQTLVPPKTLKPRANVLIRWCDNYGRGDLVRPLAHANNSTNYASLRSWTNVAARLAVWDYWICFSGLPQFPLPYTMVQCVGPDLKLFADCGATSFFAESPTYLEAGEHFTALKFWLGYQLLVHPDQPADPLIGLFMDGYYGAASQPMHDYLSYLQGRIDREAGSMETARRPWQLEYLDTAFFQTAEKLFDEAEAKVQPDSLEARHVKRERFIVDGALLQLWPWLDRRLAPGEMLPFDHEALIRRYEANWRLYEKHNFHWFTIRQQGRLEALTALFRDPQWPEPFRSLPRRDVADFNWLCWRNFEERYWPMKAHFVADPEAAGGMALARADWPDTETASLLTVEMTDRPNVTLAPADLHPDGRYHAYRVGRMTVGPESTVRALGGHLYVNVDRLLQSNATDQAANEWDVYVSMKVKGPAFVKESAEPNGVWIDRVFLVKPQSEQGGASRDDGREAEPAARAEAVSRLFARWDNTNSPGASVAIVKDGAVVFRRGFGMADVEAGRPITPATVFDAASLGKQFTGFALSTLIEQGKVAVGDDVRKHLPEVPDFGHVITIGDLLHHTSGLRDWGTGTYTNDPPRPLALTTAGILEMVTREKVLDSVPGTRNKYCNTGYNLLAAVAERVTGSSLRGWMNDNVFGPLAMSSTQLREDFSGPLADQASLYYTNEAGVFVKSVGGPAPIGSSALYTSADDFAKWLINMDAASVGGTAVLARMREPGALNDGNRVDYGYGLCLGLVRGKAMVSHAGAYGYTSSFCHVPEERLGVVVLSNTGDAEVWGMAAHMCALWLDGR